MITNKDKLKMSGFTGIREVGETLDERIDEVHGMFDKHAGSLERLRGKLLNTTSPSSSVWSLTQLSFQDGNVIVNKASSEYWGNEDNPYLPGWIDPIWPELPRVDPEDYPSTNSPEYDPVLGPDIAEASDNFNNPTPNPPGPFMDDCGIVTLTATPNNFEFTDANKNDMLIVSLVFNWSLPIGFMAFSVVELRWYWGLGFPPSWFHVYQVWDHGLPTESVHEMDNRETISYSFRQQVVQDPFYLGFRVDWDDVPVGSEMPLVLTAKSRLGSNCSWGSRYSTCTATINGKANTFSNPDVDYGGCTPKMKKYYKVTISGCGGDFAFINGETIVTFGVNTWYKWISPGWFLTVGWGSWTGSGTNWRTNIVYPYGSSDKWWLGSVLFCGHITDAYSEYICNDAGSCALSAGATCVVSEYIG